MATKYKAVQKCANIFVPNIPHLLSKQLCKNVLICVVFTST